LADIAKCNPIEFTSRASDVFAKVTPVLGQVKKNGEIKIFTLGLGRFSEAILTYKEETESDEKKDSDINFSEFATSCAAAFDVVFTNWRKHKDTTIRLAVAECIGLLTEVMSKKKFYTKFTEIILYFTSSLAKAPASYLPALTSGLKSVLKVMLRDDIGGNERQVEDIEKLMQGVLDSIHSIAAQPTNFEDNKSMKNHKNVLQCFEYITKARQTETLTYLLSKLQSKSATTRLGSLVVLRHIVNTMDDRLEGSKSLILSSCQVLLSETDISVKKGLIQLIMSMADNDYLTLEGGQRMILFLVKQCGQSKKKELMMKRKLI